LNGLALDIRHTLRSLRKTPGLFAIALLTIALGVGANTAAFSVINSVLLSPLPYPDSDRLMSLWPEKRWSQGMLADVRERVTSFESISLRTSDAFTLLGDGPAETIIGRLVSATEFDVLGVRPLLGAGLIPGDAVAERGAVVVLSHSFWQNRMGGDPDILGKTIRLAGRGLESRTVVGVLPPGFMPVTAEVWAPMIETPDQPGYYSSYGLAAAGRLRPGVTVEQASLELRGLVEELTPLHATQFRPIRHSPVDVVPMLDSMVREVRTQLLILMGAVGFILLIACTNIANLLLARSHSRQGEIALQMALGGSRGRVVRQLFTESILLGAIGGVIGVVSALYALPVLATFVSSQLPRSAEIAMDARALGFAVAISMLAGIIAGAAPALRAYRSSPGEMLRAGGGRGQSQNRGAGRLNNVLVSAEIALCLVLLAGAGLMLKSMHQLSRVDTAFSADNVLTVQYTIPPVRYDSAGVREMLRQRIEERLLAMPGVESVASIDYLPLSGSWSGSPYRVEGREAPDGASEVVINRTVSPGTFSLLRVPLVSGRLFEAADAGFSSEQEAVIVVNEAFAEQNWPGGSAVGKRLLWDSGEPMGTVIGVVRNARFATLTEAPHPEIYGSSTQVGWGTSGFLLVRGTAGLPQGDAVVRALHEIDPELATRNIRALEQVTHAASSNTRFYARLLLGFAGLALLLGLVGVYGVMSYAVSRRTKEIGVRLALGATPRAILLSVLGRTMAPVGIGVGAGLLGALLLTRLIAGLVFEVDVLDPWVLVTVGVLLAATGAIAALVPASRAARVSPTQAMVAE
jgi:putative ABC transport system permease protein